MKNFRKRCAALALAAALAFSLAQPALASYALGTELSAQATPLGTGTTLTAQSLWSASKSDLRTEHYVTYTPNATVKPVIFSGTYVASTNTVASAAAQLEGEGGWLINASGKLLEQANGEQVLTVTGLTPLAPAAGTHLVTDEAAAFKRESLLGLLQALEERELLEQAMSIDLTRDAWIEMEFTQRFRVKLPYGADYLHKLRALEAAISSREEYETGIMDLTQPDYDVVFQPD